MASKKEAVPKCKKCGKEISGPMNMKMHLVRAHDFSLKDAGLNPESKTAKILTGKLDGWGKSAKKSSKKNGKAAIVAKLTKKAAPKKAAKAPAVSKKTAEIASAL